MIRFLISDLGQKWKDLLTSTMHGISQKILEPLALTSGDKQHKFRKQRMKK